MNCSCSLVLRCTVCEMALDTEATHAGQVGAALFGATRYAVCSGCGREIPRDEWTRHYKRRWTNRVRRNEERARVLALLRGRLADSPEHWWYPAPLATSAATLDALHDEGAVERMRGVLGGWVYRAVAL